MLNNITQCNPSAVIGRFYTDAEYEPFNISNSTCAQSHMRARTIEDLWSLLDTFSAWSFIRRSSLFMMFICAILMEQVCVANELQFLRVFKDIWSVNLSIHSFKKNPSMFSVTALLSYDKESWHFPIHKCGKCSSK